jgi:hypothetical protein
VKTAASKPDEINSAPGSSKFNLTDFKTYFSNLGEKKVTEGMENFWKSFDHEVYTLWFVRYEKQKGEGVIQHQTSNLMNSFIQRLDEKFRVDGFSMLAVLGDEPNLEIQGVWMLKGKSIPQLNYPLFDLSSKRLDSMIPDDRKLVKDFWCA